MTRFFPHQKARSLPTRKRDADRLSRRAHWNLRNRRSGMSVAQNAREFPSIRCLLPDIRETGGGIQVRRAVCSLLVETMRSEFQRSVAGHREDTNALLIERPVVFRALGTALPQGFHIPVVTLESCGVVEKLEIGAEAAAELGDVAGVVGVEELSRCG